MYNFPLFSQPYSEINLDEEEEEMEEEEEEKKIKQEKERCQICSKEVPNLGQHMKENHPELLSTPKKMDLFINNIEIIKKRVMACQIIENNIDYSKINKNSKTYQEFMEAKKKLHALIDGKCE